MSDIEVNYQTLESVLSDMQTLRSELKKRGATEFFFFFFFNNFEVFGYLTKHSFESLI